VVKVILQLYPTVRAEDEAERTRLRPIGRNAERYQEAIAGLPAIMKACDDLGLWGVSTIEHHFHSEGYEVGPTPGILNGHWAALTEKVRIGQLGYTMTAQSPIRVAEETAILDHLTRGRCFVGFTRGYQNRWTNVLGQHLGARATRSDKSDDDEHNRILFEEQVDLVLKAWTEDSFTYRSKNWQFPYPEDEGIPDWFMGEWTRKLGAPGEMDENNIIRRTCVVPSPYTKPHPKVFVASNASVETVEYCAPRGFIPAYFSKIDRAAEYAGAYVRAGEKAGKRYAYGQNQAVVRWPAIAPTHEQAMADMLAFSGDIFRHFYVGVLPGALEKARNASPAELADMMERSGLFSNGTVSEIRDEFVNQWKALPAEYAVLIYHYAQQPADSVIENLRLFMEEVAPALAEYTKYDTAAEAAE
jgi:alkanesulfonate monooxygenase SsuD/methylene tetrahydromethanopterin reductase-like flavin-dependent oxidoreductase (luciferase family)